MMRSGLVIPRLVSSFFALPSDHIPNTGAITQYMGQEDGRAMGTGLA
jgi:hypothetical protein